ncbi:MAG: hypothetical protein AABZ73_06600, partial [Pseudomonadota bacterium]
SLAGFSPQAARAIRLAEAKTTAIFFIVYGSHSIMPRLARYRCGPTRATRINVCDAQINAFLRR